MRCLLPFFRLAPAHWFDHEVVPEPAGLSESLLALPTRRLERSEKHTLDTEGVVVLRQLISDHRILDVLREYITRSKGMNYPYLFNGAIKTLITNSSFGQLAADALEVESVRLADADVWAKAGVDDPGPSQPWHKDVHNTHGPGEPYVTIWLGLTEAPQSLEFILGSNAFTPNCTFPNRTTLWTNGVDQDCIDKDAFLQNGDVWHRGHSHRSDRVAITGRFVPADLLFEGALEVDITYKQHYAAYSPKLCEPLGGPLFPVIFPRNKATFDHEKWPVLLTEDDVAVGADSMTRWMDNGFPLARCANSKKKISSSSEHQPQLLLQHSFTPEPAADEGSGMHQPQLLSQHSFTPEPAEDEGIQWQKVKSLRFWGIDRHPSIGRFAELLHYVLKVPISHITMHDLSPYCPLATELKGAVDCNPPSPFTPFKNGHSTSREEVLSAMREMGLPLGTSHLNGNLNQVELLKAVHQLQTNKAFRTADVIVCTVVQSFCQLLAYSSKTMLLMPTWYYDHRREGDCMWTQQYTDWIRCSLDVVNCPHSFLPSWHMVIATTTFSQAWVEHSIGLKIPLLSHGLPSLSWFHTGLDWWRQEHPVLEDSFLIWPESKGENKAMAIAWQDFVRRMGGDLVSLVKAPLEYAKAKYGKYTKEQLLRHRGVVVLPYAEWSLSLADLYWTGMPMFIPNKVVWTNNLDFKRKDNDPLRSFTLNRGFLWSFLPGLDLPICYGEDALLKNASDDVARLRSLMNKALACLTDQGSDSGPTAGPLCEEQWKASYELCEQIKRDHDVAPHYCFWNPWTENPFAEKWFDTMWLYNAPGLIKWHTPVDLEDKLREWTWKTTRTYRRRMQKVLDAELQQIREVLGHRLFTAIDARENMAGQRLQSQVVEVKASEANSASCEERSYQQYVFDGFWEFWESVSKSDDPSLLPCLIQGSKLHQEALKCFYPDCVAKEDRAAFAEFLSAWPSALEECIALGHASEVAKTVALLNETYAETYRLTDDCGEHILHGTKSLAAASWRDAIFSLGVQELRRYVEFQMAESAEEVLVALAGLISQHSGIDGMVHVAQIGASKGEIAESLLKSSSSIHVMIVDDFPNDSITAQCNFNESETFQTVLEEIVQRTEPFANRLKIRLESSLETASNTPQRSLEIVYFDIDADEDQWLVQIRAWLGKVRPGGFLVGQGWNHHQHDLTKSLFTLFSSSALSLGPDGVWLAKVF